jgi:hypothetical protein
MFSRVFRSCASFCRLRPAPLVREARFGFHVAVVVPAVYGLDCTLSSKGCHCISYRRVPLYSAVRMPRACLSRLIAATCVAKTSALDPARPLLDPQQPATCHCVTARTLTYVIMIWQHFIQMPPLTPTCPVPTTISPILVMILLSDTQFKQRISQYRQHFGGNCHVVQAVPIPWSLGLGHPTRQVQELATAWLEGVRSSRRRLFNHSSSAHNNSKRPPSPPPNPANFPLASTMVGPLFFAARTECVCWFGCHRHCSSG